MLLDGSDERVVVSARRHDVDLVIQLEQGVDAVAHQEAVLGEDEAQHHGGSVVGGAAVVP